MSGSEVQLKPETLQAFEAYIREAESAMDQTLRDGLPFLWADADAERAQQVSQGKTLAQFWSGHGPVKVPNGLIHDWIGSVFVSGATVEQTVRMVQDYNNHKNIYKPEVLDSKLLSRQGSNFKIYMRLLKHKIITVVLDTYHTVHYSSLDSARWLCRSYTTKIQEVEGAGDPNERILPPDSGHGFVWRLYSYWRFHEKNGGVFVECRAVSLSRNVPLALRLVIQPIVQKLPMESLINTLNATRRALTGT